MKFVQIHSNVTITVTPGLQYANHTKLDSDIKDRLKVAPQWVDGCIKIKQGQHDYPAIVAEYPTVKSLARDGVLTIGKFFETEPNEEATQLEQNINKMNETSTKESKNSVKIKGVNLEKLAKEE